MSGPTAFQTQSAVRALVAAKAGETDHTPRRGRGPRELKVSDPESSKPTADLYRLRTAPSRSPDVAYLLLTVRELRSMVTRS
jgi:hypothetical protein